MKQNEIIELDGKRYRVQLHELKAPTYEEALEVVRPMFWADANSNVTSKDNIPVYSLPTEKDALSVIAYRKLKVLEAFYNGGAEKKVWIIKTSYGFFVSDNVVEIFGFKDAKTANSFIEEQKELLKQFYQL